MPTLSMFFGIIIRMQSERGGKHHKPQIHCIYGSDAVVIALDGEILEGNFPANKLTLVKAWMTIHAEELQADWDLLAAGDGYFRIDPLR